jgi:nicotinamide-nucleotide amidase
MLAEIIAVGSEMLTPHRQDTNSLYLTAQLNNLGVSVGFKTIVGDNRAHLTDAVRAALRRADIVVLSGGLGPTEDDLTRECVAEVLGLALTPNMAVLEGLHRRFAARNMAMPPNNVRQADVLTGAELLPNANGSAPGQYLDTVFPDAAGRDFRKIVVLLPGPPRELQSVFEEGARPRLRAALPANFLARRVLRMALIPESTVDARTAPIYSQFQDIDTTILAGNAEIQLHFVCTKPTLAEAEARVNQLADLILQEMGDDIFSAHDEPLEAVVLRRLLQRGHTLAVAESCTGGLLAERLTGIPGSSSVFLGGAVAYSSAAKTALAGVPAQLLEDKGAVNDTVARLLAQGIRQRIGASIAISITGIAGPAVTSGPDAAKPVGLVLIGLTDDDDTHVKLLHIPGDRDRVRLWATQHALEFVRRHLQ